MNPTAKERKETLLPDGVGEIGLWMGHVSKQTNRKKKKKREKDFQGTDSTYHYPLLNNIGDQIRKTFVNFHY